MLPEDVLQIVLIMVVAGVMGGTWNALNECADQNKLEGQADKSLITLRAWARWSFQGLCAAALVPLFLSLVDSQLLTKVTGVDAFVFGGFCLIAAISARQFVGTLTDRVLQMAQQAQEQSAEAKAQAEDAQAKAEDAQNVSQVAHEKAEDAQVTSLAAVDAQMATPAAPTTATVTAAGDDAPQAFGIDAEPADAASDPNKGRFGGAASRDGKVLEASLRALGDRPGYMVVQLKVASTDPAQPLAGDVQFFLHPTFPNPQPTVRVVDGVARFTCMSWGAFTVGAVHEGTRLELDLAEHPDAREPWKSR